MVIIIHKKYIEDLLSIENPDACETAGPDIDDNSIQQLWDYSCTCERENKSFKTIIEIIHEVVRHLWD